MTISWSLNWYGETEIATYFGIWNLNIDLVLEEEASLWHGDVPFRPDYIPSSLVNARARVRRIRHVCLRENRLARAQTLSRTLHTGGDERGNWSDNDLDGWVDQHFLC